MLLNQGTAHGRTAVSRTLIVALVVVVVVGAVSVLYYAGSPARTSAPATTVSQSPLILYVADAYAQEGQSLLQAFSAQTGIAVAPPKAAGSLVLAQQIAQGNPVSVFISVSKPAVQVQYLKNQSSGWAIGFASDQMTIAYSNATLQSPTASSIVAAYARASASNSTADWRSFFNNLSSGTVKVGIANPNADPAGYRGWIVLEAAGGAYADSSTYFAHQMLASSGNVTGSSAANLIAPLQAGQIQFLFIYRSAALSQNLRYFQLPDVINLGNPSKAASYAKFSYVLSTGTQKGSPIVLYIAVPKDSIDFADSVRFASFVVQNDRAILGAYSLTVLSRAILYNDTTVPGQISQLLGTGLLKEGGAL